MRSDSSADGVPSISLLKELARKHKRVTGCSHGDALEFVARRGGFGSWQALLLARSSETIAPLQEAAPISKWQRSLEQDIGSVYHLRRSGLAALIADRFASREPFVRVEVLPIAASNRTTKIHRLRIEDRIWHVSRRRDWLYLHLEATARRSRDGGTAYMGDCSRITYLPEYDGRPPWATEGWYVVKYGSERCIPLHGISMEALAELAFQYGLSLGDELRSPRLRFFESPAFASVQSAIAELVHGPHNPRGRGYVNPYLGDWVRVARGEPAEAAFQPWEFQR